MSVSHPVDTDWCLTDAMAETIMKCINNATIRRCTLNLVSAIVLTGITTTNLATAVAHAVTYLKMTGLTGFQLVCHRYTITGPFCCSIQGPGFRLYCIIGDL